MQLTYDEALETIIEHTEIGYSIASQDRLWIVFIFDLWSTGMWRYNRLYPLNDGAWSYELMSLGFAEQPRVLVWTTRQEAEAYAKGLRERLEEKCAANKFETPEVFVMNLGDDARCESARIGRDDGRQVRSTPKFKGSQRAWDALIEMRERAT